MLNRCSIRFKPADRAGQSMTPIFSWSKFPMMTLAMYLGHYLESGWNMARQYLRNVSQLAVGLYLDTLRLLERPYQRLAHPNGHPEKVCSKPLGPSSVSVVFNDVSLSVILSRSSPHPYMSVTCGYMKAFLKSTVAQLPIPGDYGQTQVRLYSVTL